MATDVNANQSTESDVERTRGGRWFRPAVDIVEKGDELQLIADLPGATSETIEIDFEDGLLTIEGKAPARYEENFEFRLAEYAVGDFHRSFRVSEQIDAARIQAEFKNGVLVVHLPKAEAAKPRKIAVQAN
jgi:HSP20 family molecular chaperone IbpA